MASDRAQLPYSFHTAPGAVQVAVGLAVIAIAVGTRVALEPYLGPRLELITLWGALIPLAWLLRGGIFWACSVIGLLAAYWFVIHRHGTFRFADLGSVLLVAFSLVIIAGLWASVRIARRAFDQYVRIRTQEGVTESRLAAIVQNSDDAIISMDLTGKILSFNPAAERVFGYQAHEIVGKPIQVLIPDERVHEEPRIIERIVAGERIEHLETQRKTRRGELIDVLLTISPVRDQAGTIVGVSKITRDITARKAMERERDRALERFARVTQTLPDMVFLLETETFAPILTNPAVAQILGYTHEELRSFGDRVSRTLIHPEDVDSALANLRRATQLADGEFMDFEHRALRGNGDWAILRARLTPFERDSEQRCTVLLAVDRDITRERLDQMQLSEYREGLERLVEQRTVELEQSHAQLRAAERMTALGTLSQGLGHDIGNLVLPLRLRVQSLRSGAQTEAALADLDSIDAGLSYVQGLSRSLRMLAMDPADPRQSGAGVTDLEEWWPTALPVLKTVLPRSGSLKWTLRKPEAPLIAAIAPHQLLQAVFNLVQNAAEALEGFDGNNEIEVAAEPGSTVDGSGTVRVSVIDRGPGMTDDVRLRCMEPFFSTKSRRLSGGLGLSLVAAITGSVGGKVELESAPGLGSRFTLELKAAQPAKFGQPAEPSHPHPTAAVSVRDSRTLAYVQWTMRLLGIEAKPLRDGERPTAKLWVVDPQRAEDAADFAREDNHWAIVLGDPYPNGAATTVEPKNQRVLFAGARPPVSELRRILSRAYSPPAPQKETPQ